MSVLREAFILKKVQFFRSDRTSRRASVRPSVFAWCLTVTFLTKKELVQQAIRYLCPFVCLFPLLFKLDLISIMFSAVKNVTAKSEFPVVLPIIQILPVTGQIFQ